MKINKLNKKLATSYTYGNTSPMSRLSVTAGGRFGGKRGNDARGLAPSATCKKQPPIPGTTPQPPPANTNTVAQSHNDRICFPRPHHLRNQIKSNVKYSIKIMIYFCYNTKYQQQTYDTNVCVELLLVIAKLQFRIIVFRKII